MPARIDLNLPEKVRKFFCVDPRVVHLVRRLEDVPGLDLCRRAPLCIAVSDCVAKDLACSLQSALGDVACTPRINRSHHSYDLWRLDLIRPEVTRAREGCSSPADARLSLRGAGSCHPSSDPAKALQRSRKSSQPHTSGRLLAFLCALGSTPAASTLRASMCSSRAHTTGICWIS